MDIAIIGVSGVFPGAGTIRDYWTNLGNGKLCLTDIPEDRWENGVRYSGAVGDDGKIYCPTGGFIDSWKRFDNEYFGIDDKEAAIIDPTQRIMLELTKKVFDDAGYAKKAYSGANIAVYIGASQVASSEWNASHIQVMQCGRQVQGEFFDRFGDPIWEPSMLPSSLVNLIAGRISNEFNLVGPSLVIDTACSSALVALHHACRSIGAGDCDLAICGGINLLLTPSAYYGFSAARALSVTGRLSAFDANADGFVPGEGAGIVLLKKLKDAVADGNHIYAVIKGSFVNNDGTTMGVMVPNPKAQRRVIEHFYHTAKIKPYDISYIEAHGTGTPIGDLSEFNSLSAVFADFGVREKSVYLGSVKSNIGHLLTASGIAGIIKIVGMMHNRTIYPQISFDKPHPKMKVDNSPFLIPTQPVNEVGIEFAAINSFGFGGTNAHMILENGQKYNNKSTPHGVSHALVRIGAHNSATLNNRRQNLKTFVQGNDVNCIDIALNISKFDGDSLYYASGVVNGKVSLLNVLSNADIHICEHSRICLLFTGQGSQYKHMGQEIYESVPLYRRYFDECSRLFLEKASLDIKTLLFQDEDLTSLTETQITQPIIFSIGYALGKILLEAGLRPRCMIGHSVGEWIAATLSGVVCLEAAAEIIVKRSELMSRMNGQGSMIAVFSKYDENLSALMEQCNIWLSANNASHVVIGGRHENITKAKKLLQSRQIMYRDLNTASAFHTPLFDEISREFLEFLRAYKFCKPKFPIIGNLTGDAVEDYSTEYWARHIVNPVQFEHCVDYLIRQNIDTLIECGGNSTLIAMASAKKQFDSIHFMSPKDHSIDVFFKGVQGVLKNSPAFDLSAFYPEIRLNHLMLPEYPFMGSEKTFIQIKPCNRVNIWEWSPFMGKVNTVLPDISVGFDELKLVTEALVDAERDSLYVVVDLIASEDEGGIKETGETDDILDWFVAAHEFLVFIDKKSICREIYIQLNVMEPKTMTACAMDSLAYYMTTLSSQINNIKSIVTVMHERLPTDRDMIVNCPQSLLKRDNDHRLHCRRLVFVEIPAADNTSGYQRTNHLVIGGTGGIGREVVNDIVAKSDGHVFVLGRKSLEQVKQKMPDFGHKVHYIACDATDVSLLQKTVDKIEDEYGAIDIIYHMAGAMNKGIFCTTKTLTSEIKDVLKPKIGVSLSIDQVFKHRKPRKLILFSSISASEKEWANGLADYAAANMFLDDYAQISHFNATAINYSLWDISDGIDKSLESTQKIAMLSANGLNLVTPEHGIRILNSIVQLQNDENRNMVFHVNGEKASLIARDATSADRETAQIDTVPACHLSGIELKIEIYSIFQRHAGQEINDGNEQDNFLSLGIDSIKACQRKIRTSQLLGMHWKCQAVAMNGNFGTT
jgi:acyl transferase domain-containing protein